MHVLYTLLGVGALMHTTPWLLTVAKVVGGAYILYLGVSLMRSKPKTVLEGDKGADEPVVEQTLLKAFTTGFLTNATNPKATLFFLAIFTTIISTTTPLQDSGAVRSLDVFRECIVVCHRGAVFFQRPGAIAVHAHGALVRANHGGDPDPVRRSLDFVDVNTRESSRRRLHSRRPLTPPYVRFYGLDIQHNPSISGNRTALQPCPHRSPARLSPAFAPVVFFKIMALWFD